MPLFVIPYPVIDPIAFEIGPLAVRWYGLAYMAGILLGWLYGRYLLSRPDLWNGKPPMTISQADDFLLVDHARHRARRQARLRSVLRAELFLGQPARNSRGLERWHVLPRRTARRRRRRLFLLPRQGHQPAVARRYRLGGDALRPVLRPHRQLHQFRGGWAGERRALGHGVSRRRRRAAPSEPAL